MKVADTMGVVYTPPLIVRFMIASVDDLLKQKFGKDLGAAGVHVIDPFTGTGNFLVHLMRVLPVAALKRKYGTELWTNEIMLLPYYIAAQNIEHEYFEKTGAYEPFPGLSGNLCRKSAARVAAHPIGGGFCGVRQGGRKARGAAHRL